MSFIGLVLIIVAASTVIGVLYFVMKEPHTHEEYYVPPQPASQSDHHTSPDAMMTAEITGTEQLSASPIIDAEQKRRAEEERD